MSERTIAEFIDESPKFDCCFWTTFTVDFATVNFLLQQHIKPILRTPNFHLMVDARELDRVCRLPDGLNTSRKLFSNAVLSTVLAPVAFHPKIFFFGSDRHIRVLVTSGNATPTGVLSNVDIIARFDYSAENEESRGKVAEVYRFLASFPNWHRTAQHALKSLVDQPEVLLPTTSILFRPQERSHLV